MLFLFLHYFLGISNYTSFNFVYILHLPLGGFFMYLYGRAIGVDRKGALLSGLIFAYCGFNLQEAADRELINTYTWFPLILFFLEKGLRKAKIDWRYIILCGFFYGIQWLGGYTPFSYYFSFFIILYLLFKYLLIRRGERGKFIIAFLVIFAISTGIFAVQFFPSLELAKMTPRLNPGPYENLYKYSMVNNLFKAIVPILEYQENFVRIIPIFLSLLFIFSSQKRKFCYFYLFAISFFLIISSRNFISKFLYSHFPYFSIIDEPHNRFLFFFIFFLSILAGLGLSQIRYSWLKDVVLGIFILCVYPNFRMEDYKRAYLEDFIKFRPGIINSYTKFNEEYAEFLSIKRFLDNIEESGLFRIFLIPLYNTSYIYDFGSYPYSSNGRSDLLSSRHIEFSRVSAESNIDYDRESPFIDFLFYPNYLRLTNTKYIIVPKKECYIEDKQLRYFENNPLFSKVYEDSTIYVIRFEDCGERAFFVTDFLCIKDKQKILDTLKQSSFNLQKTVILEEPPKKLLLPAQRSELKTNVYIVNYLPNKVKIKVDAKSCGFLILLDTYYPGWKAYIDGRESKIYRANYLFRAVYIPTKGEHIIEFIYSPFSFKIGSVISGLTFLICGISLILLKKKEI